MENSNLPPVLSNDNADNNSKRPITSLTIEEIWGNSKYRQNIILCIVVPIIVIIGIITSFKNDDSNNSSRTNSSTSQQQTYAPQTPKKSYTIPEDMAYIIKVDDNITYADQVFINYKPVIEDITQTSRINGPARIRAYKMEDGNYFVMEYQSSDGMIKHLEIANPVTKKAINLQSIPGYPIIRKGASLDEFPDF